MLSDDTYLLRELPAVRLMKHINDFFQLLTSIVEQRDIRRVSNVRRRTGRIQQQRALVWVFLGSR